MPTYCHAQYRHALPQMSAGIFLTDGGLETELIFNDGMDLPEFASFPLLTTPSGRARLKAYFTHYVKIAKERKVGFILETPTWRASQSWGDKLGFTPETIRAVNADAIELMIDIRRTMETPETPCVISGCIGPRGDGYQPDVLMTAQEAQAYHSVQIDTLAAMQTDFVTALTIPYVEEAIGATRAAMAAAIPIVISFTVETDGRLPSGQLLGDAVRHVDKETTAGPAYYMINCAHPSHFADALSNQEPWLHRVRGVRANASRLSHAELDECETLDDGDPVAFGTDYQALRAVVPNLVVMGGCCGTDHRHIEAICHACVDKAA